MKVIEKMYEGRLDEVKFFLYSLAGKEVPKETNIDKPPPGMLSAKDGAGILDMMRSFKGKS